ncbi:MULTISPECIES: hypothetical protein [Weeksella]|uniref:Uncharacterized protein n=1 Tax=Weeksella virosa (strain ATCC 43766 / DSM 16922 / JCM 21250 / CCUG 30538 / CDC 9751 / IAM 14551 / NBRC 16016 / NCTC 11634 / CL345/78) TaxID=865938 RepID=F0NYB0_WEEVC|nr:MULTISPECIES: hypothetical protein [Weeksella]ADX68107.1 hypothetical protein Weevi_1406 [Weeksella virosa DSM 16922]MDK7374910.1 hypothetical protein [Weeksella virosa]MDK7675447.1 hypothetical protein [Weeksella virosa]OFM83895.1 hypothetical protein HMPREF2660_10260 [Weeksella sp. HMSC059D05]SUP54418.1 Uncharacterised protein [Weeksella virosa]
MKKQNPTTILTIAILLLVVGSIIFFNDRLEGKDKMDVSNAVILVLGVFLVGYGLVKYFKQKND